MGNCVDKPDHPLIPIFQMPELSLDCFWNWFANISQMANLGLCERVGVHPSIDFLRHLVNLLFQFSVRRGTIIQTAQVNLHGSAARTQSFNPARDFLVDEVWSREFCCKGVLRSDLQLAMHSICAASAITGITHILGLLIKKISAQKSFLQPLAKIYWSPCQILSAFPEHDSQGSLPSPWHSSHSDSSISSITSVSSTSSSCPSGPDIMLIVVLLICLKSWMRPLPAQI